MNRHAAWTLMLVAGAWATEPASAQMANQPAPQKKAGTQPAPAARAAIDPEAVKAQREADLKALQAMNPVLAEWEKRSASVTSLDVVFDKIERDKGFGDQIYRGRAMLQSPDKACLQFTKYILDKNNKPVILIDEKGKKVANLEKVPETRIVCTGTEVLQYNWGAKSITVYPLDKQVRRKALQEGPLPFLFNMKAAEAKKRYSMRLLKESDSQYLIGIIPNEEIDRDAFAQAILWLNKKTFLPDQLWLLPVGGKNKEEYVFNGPNDVILANQPMEQKYFQFQKFDEWKVVVNKGEPGNAAAPGPIEVRTKQQAAKPGTRPQ